MLSAEGLAAYVPDRPMLPDKPGFPALGEGQAADQERNLRAR